jgi:hypothetical protein
VPHDSWLVLLDCGCGDSPDREEGQGRLIISSAPSRSTVSAQALKWKNADSEHANSDTITRKGNEGKGQAFA